MITLDPGQCVHKLFVTHHETHPPARHVVALAHREELNRNIPRTSDLHDRWRLESIEANICIGQVMHHQDIVLLGERHNPLKKIQLDTLCRGITREAQNNHLRLWNRLTDVALEFLEEINPAAHPKRLNAGPGDDGAIDMNWIAGIGHQDGIPGIERSQHQVGEPLLRTDRDNRLRFRIQADVVSALVPITNRPAQTRNALGHRIAMGMFFFGRLDEFLDNMTRRGAIGITHAHINNVLTASTGGHLQFPGNVEHIGGESLDAGKWLHGGQDGRAHGWENLNFNRAQDLQKTA